MGPRPRIHAAASFPRRSGGSRGQRTRGSCATCGCEWPNLTTAWPRTPVGLPSSPLRAWPASQPQPSVCVGLVGTSGGPSSGMGPNKHCLMPNKHCRWGASTHGSCCPSGSRGSGVHDPAPQCPCHCWAGPETSGPETTIGYRFGVPGEVSHTPPLQARLQGRHSTRARGDLSWQGPSPGIPSLLCPRGSWVSRIQDVPRPGGLSGKWEAVGVSVIAVGMAPPLCQLAHPACHRVFLGLAIWWPTPPPLPRGGPRSCHVPR